MRIWQLTGSIEPFIDPKTQEWKRGNPKLKLHAGTGTLHDAQMKGAELGIVLGTDVPDPLLVIYDIPTFSQVDIYPSDAPGIIVSTQFIAEFSQEIREYCWEYPVKPVKALPSTTMLESREQLLKRADKEYTLYLLYPKGRIIVQNINMRNDEVFIQADKPLPPIFETQIDASGVCITDDVKLRIERAGLRGAEYNYNIDFFLSNWRQDQVSR